MAVRVGSPTLKRRCGGFWTKTTSSSSSSSPIATPFAPPSSQSLASGVDIGSILTLPVGNNASSLPYVVFWRRGAGISSVVYDCRKREGEGSTTGPDLVTVKIMSGGKKGMNNFLGEVEILTFLKLKREEAGLAVDEARCVELVAWFYRRSAMGGVDNICLVFAGGGVSLLEAMKDRVAAGHPWSLDEVREVAKGLLEGINFIHSTGLIHADIKPENITLYPQEAPTAPTHAPAPWCPPSSGSSSWPPPPAVAPVPTPAPSPTPAPACTAPCPFSVRLIDFGNSIFLDNAEPGKTCGTPSYLAPEALLGQPWGYGVDVWAAGCVLYELATGERVGGGQGAMGVAGSSAGVEDWGSRAWGAGSDAAAAVVGTRFGAGGGGGATACACGLAAFCAEHKIANPELLRLVGRLLERDPGRRPSATEALEDVFFRAIA
ncbi:unnamed protein product [Discosporangium mesarthrocarpum]